MDLIIDANILFAALIKNSQTIKIILNKKLKLYAPEFLLEEFKKYKKEILKKTHRTDGDFEEIFNILREVICLIPNKETNFFLTEAEKTCPDKNDIDYFALALKFNCPVWSNDKKLKEQNRVRIYSTRDLIAILEL